MPSAWEGICIGGISWLPLSIAAYHLILKRGKYLILEIVGIPTNVGITTKLHFFAKQIVDTAPNLKVRPSYLLLHNHLDFVIQPPLCVTKIPEKIISLGYVNLAMDL